VTLGGRRILRAGVFRSCDVPDAEVPWWEPNAGKDNVWDEGLWGAQGPQGGGLRDLVMTHGSAYLSSPYCFEHGVRYQAGSMEEPVIALQCRFAFDAALGEQLNDLRDGVMWDISNTISEVLGAASARGELRMPALEELREAEARVPGVWGVSVSAPA